MDRPPAANDVAYESFATDVLDASATAVDENHLSLPHHGSSWTLSCSTDDRCGSPSQMATRGVRLEYDFADCVADQLSDAASRPRGGLAQRIKLFLAEINLSLFHVCQLKCVN